MASREPRERGAWPLSLPCATPPRHAMSTSRTVAEHASREKRALAAHRAALRGSELPGPRHGPSDGTKGTFTHGFFLPFSLIVATMRDPTLRGPYLRVALLRGLLVVLAGTIAVAKGDITAREDKKNGRHADLAFNGREVGVVVHKSKSGEPPAAPVHVDLPGLHVDLDEKNDQASVKVLGQSVPVSRPQLAPPPTPTPPIEPTATVPEAKPAEPPTLLRRMWNRVRHSWAWLLTLIAFLSAIEGVVVFFSRRWDDWLSFHASRLAAIRPEDESPKTPKIALDLGWLYRKLKRRFRGYVVFAAGIPALLPLRLLPGAGDILFSIALTMWGWYWLGVFSAAKSAHAWADADSARMPAPIRAIHERVSGHVVFAPLRWYGKLWAKVTHSVNPAATTFERSPAAFLGFALARVILSLPGLYLLARPLVPVAAGRLCAEVDPEDRFSVQSETAATATNAANASV